MALFPSTFAGIDYAVARSKQWSTGVQTASSGKEQRVKWWSLPRYQYKLTLACVRQAGYFPGVSIDELQNLQTFFDGVYGKWNSFLYVDPVNGSPSGILFGTGDGATTSFQLVDNEGFPATNIQSLAVYRNDWQGNQLLYSTARSNMALYSESFGLSYNPSSLTITSNALTSPRGDLTAEKITIPSAGSPNFQTSAVASGSFVSGNQTVVQVFFKPTAYAGTYLNIYVGGSYQYGRQAQFTISGGLVTAVDGQSAATSVGNGWYRLVMPFTWSGSSSTCICSFTAVGAAAGDNFGLWGFDIKTGTLTPSSYIGPTTTAAASITDYSINTSSGAVTFSTAPLAGAALTWSGQFARACRFDTDEMTFQRFANLLWTGGEVTIVSLK